MNDETLRLRPFSPADLPRLATWLLAPHVAPWWPDPEAQLADARAPPAGAGHVIIEWNGEPIGYMRWQRADATALAELGLAAIPDGAVDMDILIGDGTHVGRGLGRRAVALLRDRLLADDTIPLVGMVTSTANVPALRAIEAAGFVRFDEYNDPRYGRCLVLVAVVQ